MTPEEIEKRGVWMPVEDDDYSGGGYWKCSECSHRFSFGGFNLLNHYGFCPNCGHPIKKEG
jgi:rubrerythrin